MSEYEDVDWEDLPRYNYENVESAKQVLSENFGARTAARKLFSALLEKEKSPQELMEETELNQNTIRGTINKMKKEDLVYAAGSQYSTKFYGLSIEKIHTGNYKQGIK